MSNTPPPPNDLQTIKLEIMWFWSKVSSEKVAPFWTAAYRLGVLALLAVIASQLRWDGIAVKDGESIWVNNNSFSIDSLPNVDVRSMPRISIDTLPRIEVDSLPRIYVDSLPRITLPDPVKVREVGSESTFGTRTQ